MVFRSENSASWSEIYSSDNNTLHDNQVRRNMSSSSSEHRNSSHSVTRKALKATTCYICDKVVKDYRLSSHLLFGSLQCRDCDLKFRRCRDFDSFRRSKDEKVSGSCAHQTLRWTRDPAEYLERKLQKDMKSLKSGHHRPSTREVVKEMLSYISNLKPIENKSPWRRAIEKLKKFISLKTEKLDGTNRHGGDKRSSENYGLYPSKKKHNTSRDTENYKGGSQDFGRDGKNEHYLNVANFIIDQFESHNEAQSTNGSSDDFMVPQYSEEVIIPQSEWEIEAQPISEFQECDKSIEISLGNGFSDKISFNVEEVWITRDRELGPMTLIIDNANQSTQIAEEIATALEDSVAPSKEFSESSSQQSVDSLKNTPTSENVIDEKDRKSDARKKDKKWRKATEDKKETPQLDECNISAQEKLCNNKEISTEYENTKSRESTVTSVNQVCVRNNGCETETQNTVLNGHGEHIPQKKDGEIKMNNVENYGAKNQNKEHLSGLDPDRRKSRRMRKLFYKDGESERDEKYLRSHRSNGGTIKGTKYNLRSRRSPSSESFLQKLDTSEKKRLWEKLLPIAKKLRKLNVESNGHTLSTFTIPFDYKDSDDDFLVDVLLSHVLDVQQNPSLTHYSSEGDGEDDYNHGDEIALLLNLVKRVVRQFTSSLDKSHFSAAFDSTNPSVNCCSKSDSVESSKSSDSIEISDIVEKKRQRRSKTNYINHMSFGKDYEEGQAKTFYVSPPSDGNYYVVNYPSQPLIKECPMCYFRVFPSMFSLNLVTNLATTKCVGCMLTIYVVQEPSKNNSLPKIVFRRDDSSENDHEEAKPARFKSRTQKWQRKVNVRTFFKQ
ncbi:uncharacterized protein LOC135204160 [Macrobrachium nipponense]|uniref:uncharacterized protein LOC135204160 n=1 Tax=Macrobrachium nipponense TaxID=159736 RepID=UPI0030C85C67